MNRVHYHYLTGIKSKGGSDQGLPHSPEKGGCYTYRGCGDFRQEGKKRRTEPIFSVKEKGIEPLGSDRGEHLLAWQEKRRVKKKGVPGVVEEGQNRIKMWLGSHKGKNLLIIWGDSILLTKEIEFQSHFAGKKESVIKRTLDHTRRGFISMRGGVPLSTLQRGGGLN